MNKEQFIALGLSEDLADKAAAASTEELKTYIPKSRFDEVNTAKKTAEDTLKERDAQLETLSKDANASEGLRAEITRLQDANKTAAVQHETELKQIKVDNAIAAALNGKVHNEKVVTGLLDKTTLVMTDDGKLVGLDEQIAALKTSDAYLFKPESGGQGGQGGAQGGQGSQGQGGGFRFGAGGGQQGGAQGGQNLTLADAIASHFQSQQ